MLLLGLIGCGNDRAAQRPTPSPRTWEWAVDVTHRLEAKPLAPELKVERAQLLMWIMDSAGVRVVLCPILLDPASEEPHPFPFYPEIYVQSIFEQAVFLHEHSDQPPEATAAYLGATEGALRAYDAIVAAHPEARHPYLDGLVDRRRAGTLGDLIADLKPRCGE